MGDQHEELKMSFDAQMTRFGQDKKSKSVRINMESHWRNHVVVIVNVMLGIKNVPYNYYSTIARYMKFPQFVGMVGGKPNMAYYFVGLKAPFDLIYLDPHLV